MPTVGQSGAYYGQGRLWWVCQKKYMRTINK